MGTNYYLHRNVCSHCGVSKEPPLHIGKSSAGWVFSLHVWTEDDYNTDPPFKLPRNLEDWESLWCQPEHVIRDEYGEAIAIPAMRSNVRERAWPGRKPPNELFYSDNHALPGPEGSGLVRHKFGIFGDLTRGCIAHGEGTWDLIVGEFS